MITRTYRRRLVAYVAVLLAFLVGVIVLAYRSSSAVVLAEAESNAARLAQQIESQLRVEGRDLADRARMVRDNTSFAEYLFIATSLDTDPKALRELFQRQFGWLQMDRAVVLARSGRVLLGAEARDLLAVLRARRLATANADALFPVDGAHGLELVAVAPIRYRSQQLGAVALTRAVDAKWMAAVHELTGGHVLLVRDGRIAMTSLDAGQVGAALAPRGDVVTLKGEEYLIRHLALAGEPASSQLWFVLSKAQLTEQLARQRNLMLLLAVAGCFGVLVVGALMLHNFGAPISRLMGMIKEVGAGRLPDLPRTHARDEIGFLWNQFVVMVQSLREKQEQLTVIHQQLERQAITDELTGLYNRRYLYDIYPKLCSEALRQHSSLALILIDLDNFKLVNDRFGHLAGDSVLVNFAALLHEVCRVSDFLIRLGGEEFLVLTHGDTDGAAVLAEKIRAALEQCAITDEGNIIRVTASFGVACAEESDDHNGLEQVLVRADRALYAAKQAGRNRVMSWAPTLMAVSSR
ncbi:MAG: diguanylate cyclase [Pseudomonadota bacterium]